MASGRQLVAKFDPGGDGGLDVEAQMLRYLAEHGPFHVPEVESSSRTLLLMRFVAGRTGCSAPAEGNAAELLAQLHAVRAAEFGFEYPTRIGGLVQPNDPCPTWLEFFAERRLRAMCKQARDAGRLDARRARQVDRAASRLAEWLDEPEAPSLLHGDLWSGNIITTGSKVAALIDPALYYGHPEVELAFTTLFSTFGARFYHAYGSAAGRKLDDEFFEMRRHIYNLYPLLVHVRLFGGNYVDDVSSILTRFVG